MIDPPLDQVKSVLKTMEGENWTIAPEPKPPKPPRPPKPTTPKPKAVAGADVALVLGNIEALRKS